VAADAEGGTAEIKKAAPIAAPPSEFEPCVRDQYLGDVATTAAAAAVVFAVVVELIRHLGQGDSCGTRILGRTARPRKPERRSTSFFTAS
jgi:hypothetical protein